MMFGFGNWYFDKNDVKSDASPCTKGTLFPLPTIVFFMDVSGPVLEEEDATWLGWNVRHFNWETVLLDGDI
jgi:hypothetical protein